MKKNQVIFHTFFAVICAVLLNKTSFAEPANLALLTQEVQKYHDSGAYHKEVKDIITRAQDFIKERAEANSHNEHPEKLAIVLDIDETSISNYSHMVARHFVGHREKIHREILAANAPVIKPMLRFYNYALQHGIAVFFVTGRLESERLATIKNLGDAGYHNWANLYLKPNKYQEDSVVPFKSQIRAAISQQGYTIIASLGDQLSDLKGGYAEKGFKLPNPYYYIR